MKTDTNKVKEFVRERYGKFAEADIQYVTDCCVPESNCCSGETAGRNYNAISSALGYSEKELKNVPEGANMGLGCGNPQAIANLKEGEIILDLGCGGGFDVFLAAQEIGEKGKAIGVDMTPQMITKARNNAAKGNYSNVEFRLGEIEYLPVADNQVDVIMSNCVINLSPEKQKVYNDAFRVLKKGGRLAISDVVLLKELPSEIKESLALYAGCVAGASTVDEIEGMLTKAGFVDVRVNIKEESKKFIKDWSPDSNLEDYISSGYIEAIKL